MNPPQYTIEWAIVNDPTVHRMSRYNAPLEQIIAQLAQEKKELQDRISKLDQIAPRKMIMPDGTVMVWHCPDELIPSTKP